MTLYHGSSVIVAEPDLRHSRTALDFGRGFYTTPLYEQAKKWCSRFRKKNSQGIISRYELDDAALEECNVMRFDSYSESWLNFILNCRRGIDCSDYDIVIGGIANDKVFNTVELYFDGLIDKAVALQRLRYEKPNQQVCLRTERVLTQYLRFQGSECI